MEEDTSRGWLGFAWGRAKPRAGSGRRADEGARAAWPRGMAVGSASSRPDAGASQLRNLGQVILPLCDFHKSTEILSIQECFRIHIIGLDFCLEFQNHMSNCS